MKKDIYTVAVPTWAFGYIFNGELDTITDDERAEIDEFMADIEIISVPDGEPYFDAFPPFRLPCEVADCRVIYR